MLICLFFPNIPALSPRKKEWLADNLGVRIIVFTGLVKRGRQCTDVYTPRGGGAKYKGDIWVWHRTITDDAGHGASHFDLISKAPRDLDIQPMF